MWKTRKTTIPARQHSMRPHNQATEEHRQDRPMDTYILRVCNKCISWTCIHTQTIKETCKWRWHKHVNTSLPNAVCMATKAPRHIVTWGWVEALSYWSCGPVPLIFSLYEECSGVVKKMLFSVEGQWLSSLSLFRSKDLFFHHGSSLITCTHLFLGAAYFTK